MIVRSNWQQSALPSDPTWCFGEKTWTGVARAAQCFGDAAVERAAIASGQSSTVLISKSMVSDSTSAVSRVVLSLSVYDATPCTGDIFSPQGMSRMTVKATGATPSSVASVSWLSCLRTAMTYGSPPRRIRVGRIREGSR